MLLKIIKFTLLLCLMVVGDIASGYSLTGLENGNTGESLKVELQTRSLEDDANIMLTLFGNQASAGAGYDETPDDLELAEVNIFRPVFRYRVAVSKKVRGPQFKK